MANHVFHAITIKTTSQELRSKLLDLFKKEDQSVFTEALVNCFYGTQFTLETMDYQTAIEYAGAKWADAILISIDEDEVYINLESAWEFVNPLMSQMLKWCLEIDPKCTINCTFEDEGYCFAGTYVGGNGYESEEFLDTDEYDFEDEDSFEQYLNDLGDLTHNEIVIRDNEINKNENK
jgi:hypothetical protein